jgi:hypothetical protein
MRRRRRFRRRRTFCCVPYVSGQCLDDVVFDEDELEDDDVDDLDDGELEAAWAIAVPPPTSAPEIARAMRALVIRCRMVSHLLSVPVVVAGTESTAEL